MTNSPSRNIISFFASVLLCGVVLYGTSGWFGNFTKTQKNTNPDYINPKSIEFEVKDKDFDKNKETYITYKGKEFIFKDVNGVPTSIPYTLEYKINESSGAKN